MSILHFLLFVTILAKQIVIEYAEDYPFLCGQAIPDYHYPNAFAKVDTTDVFDHRLIICEQSYSKEDIVTVHDFIREGGMVGFKLQLWDGSEKVQTTKLGTLLNETVILNYFFDFHFTVD